MFVPTLVFWNDLSGILSIDPGSKKSWKKIFFYIKNCFWRPVTASDWEIKYGVVRLRLFLKIVEGGDAAAGAEVMLKLGLVACFQGCLSDLVLVRGRKKTQSLLSRSRYYSASWDGYYILNKMEIVERFLELIYPIEKSSLTWPGFVGTSSLHVRQTPH